MKIVNSRKRVLLAAGAAVVLVLGALGVAAAQPGPTPSPAATPGGPPRAHQQFLETLASKLGISVESLRQAVQETRQEVGPRGWGWHGPHFRDHARKAMGAVKMEFSAAADYLGITTQELRDELKDGKSLAQVATEKNRSVQGLIDALAVRPFERIDRAVADGKLTAERAQQMKERTLEALTAMVNRVPPQGRGPAAFWRRAL